MPPPNSPGMAWKPWATAVTGVSGVTDASRYVVIENTVLLVVYISGISTATTKTVTLPLTPANLASIQWVAHLTVEDGGSGQTGAGEIVINANNLTASLYKTLTAGAWTGSGAWFAIGLAWYEI